MAGSLVLAAATLVTGCDVGGPDAASDFPPLHVISVEVTARVDRGGVVAFERVPVAVDGSTRPTVGTAIRVQLDRLVDPASATRQAICVQSSTALVRSLEECGAGLLLRPSYDPVSRTVTYYPESASTRLAYGTLYRATLLRREGENGFGLTTIDGAPLPGPYAVEFTTEPAPAPDGVDDAPTEGPPTHSFCDTKECLTRCAAPDAPEGCADFCGESVQKVIGDRCAFGGCHLATSSSAVPMGLELSSAASLEMTAIAHVAHGTERGAGAQDPDVAGVTLGRSMPLIAPFDAGNSYLLYKILANPAFELGELQASDDDERLREGFIVGSPMPPTLDEGNQPMSREDAILLSEWIAAGADTTQCGPPGLPPAPP